MIRKLAWDPEVLKLPRRPGDNWPITWVADDLQIAAYGDGDGFSRRTPELSLGFARIHGDPPHHRAEDFASDADTPKGGGNSAIKASGLLMVEGTLYMFVRNYRPPGSDDYTHSRLAWSKDRGVRWTWADWYFADTFGCPDFVQFGKDYEGARDGFVYIVSQANDDAYAFSPDIVLARVPKDGVPDRRRYAFFAGLDRSGEPLWSPDIEKRRPIFTDPNGTQRISMTYNAGLKRYILTASHLPPGAKGTHSPAFGVFDAPEPWGPWTTAYYAHDWSAPVRTIHHKFPTKWMSPDGRTMWLLYSGEGSFDTFCLKRATLDVRMDGSRRR
ncbi:MAG: DUF4185 domain-containing protein [Planctomycetes bacterium]|nr:DUF4185 domain-containing protein [Planctomycetota bacterium]